jgi:hypothetical protein
MIETMTEQELIESRKNIPAWKQSKKIHPEDYQKLEQKRFDMELENINKSYNKESYYDGLL